MPFGFVVHVIGSKKIRVLYDSTVTDSALSPPAYNLTLAAPGIAIVPAIASVTFYDETHRSVVLNLAVSLTFANTYSLGVSGVVDVNDETVSGFVKFFDSNVPDPPVIVGAYQSKRGCVDLVFDRSVGPTSTAATAGIRDASGGGAVAMTLRTWATEEVLPANSVRFSLPGGMPAADSYLIDYADVTDVSLNVGAGTEELTLSLRSPLPFSFAKLNQLQIVDAYVADVSNDLIQTATVRVFFNGPVGNATDQTNWTLSQDGVHVQVDTVDLVTAPDATDLASLVVLVNNFKSVYNSHRVRGNVHVRDDLVDAVTSVNAFDTQSSIDLVNEIQTKLLAHLVADGVHLSDDVVNTFTFLEVPDGALGFAVAVINDVKPRYNKHLSATYDLTLSGWYPAPVASITDFSKLSSGLVFPAESAFTYYVDLHVVTASLTSGVSVKANLLSDDGASPTSSLDYTGSIVARSVNSPVRVMANLVETDRSISLYADKDLMVSTPGESALTRPDGTPIPFRPAKVSASLPGVIWALNQLIFAYSCHIDGSSIGAGHQSVDNQNLISVGSYVSVPTLAAAISLANVFRATLVSHMSSAVFHFQEDFGTVRSAAATDLVSLVTLVEAMRHAFLSHNFLLGPHSYPGWRIVSARLFDKLTLETDGMVEDQDVVVRARVQSSYRNNAGGDVSPGGEFDGRNLGKDVFQNATLTATVDGSATRPALASALPRPAVVTDGNGRSFETDAVEVYFSKPMRMVPLDSSNLQLTGGSIMFRGASWHSPLTATVLVANMAVVSYSIAAVGLFDESGNPVWP